MPGGTSTQTTTNVQSTAPSNPDVNPTLSKLLKGMQAEYDANPKGFYFDKPMYAGTGAATDQALSSMLSGANDPRYGQAFGATFDDMANTASGGKFGMNDPGFMALRDRVASDTLTATNRAFNTSGMFGSDSNRREAGEGVANALAGLDYQNFQNDIARQERAQAGLSSAFANSFLPSQMGLKAGQLMDADAQAQLQAEGDLASRKFNAPTDYLAKMSSILAGNAATGGTNSTSSSTVPIQQPSPLQLLLGGGLGLMSLL